MKPKLKMSQFIFPAILAVLVFGSAAAIIVDAVTHPAHKAFKMP